jgi:hypothetical protein
LGRHTRIGMLAGIALGIAGCGQSHHTVSISTTNVMARWNAEVGSAVAMKVHLGSTGNHLSTDSGVVVIVYTPDTKSWMAITTTGAATDMACTNLLLSATDMRYTDASDLINEVDHAAGDQDAGHAVNGDVRFSIDRSAGVGSCSVEPAPKEG